MLPTTVVDDAVEVDGAEVVDDVEVVDASTWVVDVELVELVDVDDDVVELVDVVGAAMVVVVVGCGSPAA